MDYRKIGLYAALIIVTILLLNAWEREFPPQVNTATTVATVNATASNVPLVQQAKQAAPLLNTQEKNNLIYVKTDTLNVTIDALGGNVVQTTLLNYPEILGSNNDIQLFNQNNDTYYIAQSGLTGTQGPDTPEGQVRYNSEKNNYELTSDQNNLTVSLHWRNAQGLMVTKNFVFQRGSYAIGVNYQVENNNAKAWTGYSYTQLVRTEPAMQGSFLTHYATFVGAAISTKTGEYQKLKFNNFADEPVSQDSQGGWAAMVQQYFLSAWVPVATQNNHYYTTVSGDKYTVGMVSAPITIAPKQTFNLNQTLYVGPAIASNLDVLSPHLSMTIDYGWLWFISKIIFAVMTFVHNFVLNWGWSIIITTILIKLIFFPLSDKSFRSMAVMRKLQPKIQQLKERFGEDRQAFSRAMMDLYRQEKANPLSGCLPILIQIPVFIALYWVIIQSVEIRQAPWLFWVKDLSVHDPYYILPVIMGLLMFVQQKMSPPPPDPTQAKVMMFMPVIFTVFFLNFPAGLVLYWITNTLFTIIHQFWVYQRADKQKPKK